MAARNEKEREFKAAFENHADELFRHCLMRLADRERAVDLVQEAFCKAWEYIAGGGEVRQYRPFLYRILNNLIIDEYRRKKPRSLEMMLEEDETGVSLEGALLRDETDLLEEAMVRFDAARAVEALAALPPAYRDTLTMRYIDGLSLQEIATHLEETENAVSVRIHRGLKKLRETLEADV